MSASRWPRCRLADFDSYEPEGPYRTLISASLVSSGRTEMKVFEVLPDAIDYWVLYATPPTTNSTAVIQDRNGTVILGYNRSRLYIAGYAWFGIRQAYELLAEHRLMDLGEVTLWEIQASGAMDDITMSS